MNNKAAVRVRLATLFALLLVLMLTSFAAADEPGASSPDQAPQPTATPVVHFPIFIEAEGAGPVVPGMIVSGTNNFAPGVTRSFYMHDPAGVNERREHWSVNTRSGLVQWDPMTRTCTYIATYPGLSANDAWVEFVFYAPHAGEYFIWANTQAPNNRSDLFHIQLDNRAPFPFRAKLRHWVWAPIPYPDGGRWMLTRGLHKIRFSAIEQGGRIDGIAITDDYLDDIKEYELSLESASPSCYGGPTTGFVRPQTPDNAWPYGPMGKED